jgi:two-component system chemotaxis sensor kinase CheA
LVHERLTTRILDLPELARKAHPEWFASLPASCEPEPTAPRILLAEDSEFFRKRVRGFLESEGYEVHECEDGAIAWEALQDPENRFQLVLTDIEMPNMNGLELAQRIRSTPALAHLPVVALTSLASEDDKRRGQQVGFNDYQVKLNREQLTATLVRLLGHHKSRTGFQPVPPPDGNGHHVGRPFEAVRDRTDGLERPSYEGSPSVGAGLATGSIA